MSDQERKDFEAWAENHNADLSQYLDKDQTYVDDDVQAAWEVWQASRDALAQQAVPEAMKAAMAAIYFADSADYLPALWDVVRTLSPEIAELAERDARAAWEKADALAAAPAAPLAVPEGTRLVTLSSACRANNHLSIHNGPGRLAEATAMLEEVAAPAAPQAIPACQSCGIEATREVPSEATDFPGPYCDECGPGARSAAPQASRGAAPAAERLAQALQAAYDDLHKINAEVTDVSETLDLVNEALAIYRSEQAIQTPAVGAWQWVPVSERLPERNVEVLVAFGGISIPATGQYTGSSKDRDPNGWCYPAENNGTCDDGSDPVVTHWMPLPDPPKSDVPVQGIRP